MDSQLKCHLYVQDGLSISLEPGGQFELSGAPVVSVHETSAEVNRHIYEVSQPTQSFRFRAK